VIHLAQFFLEWKTLKKKKCRENRNTYFMFEIFFPKIVPFIRHVEKYGGAGQATDGNIIRRGRDN